MLLNILICHTPNRYDFLKRLTGVLDTQLVKYKNQVECLVDDSRYKSIAKKRNDLVARTNAKYLCFIDDDDLIVENYIDLLMPGMRKDVDCCSLKGIITEDGQNPLVFEHSIKYDAYKTNPEGMPVRYERYPNHLNCVKTEKAKLFRFPEEKHEFGNANHGEDTSYATQMFKAGVLKTEHYIDQVIYYYEYRRNK